jgi:RNA polymerase sigma-70 factor (ECF subfamily)
VNDDDRRLIAECLGGQRDAFGELVTRYQARLFNAALRLVQSPDDAADVVQDAFLNAFQSLRTFKGDAEFFTWLYRIAFNTAISLKRKKRPALSLEAHAGETGIDPDDPSEYVRPGAALERSEDERELGAAIARLSPEHREVLLMKDIDGLKYEDIAELLGVPIGTIRSRLHRARLELRELLVPSEPNGPPSPSTEQAPEGSTDVRGRPETAAGTGTTGAAHEIDGANGFPTADDPTDRPPATSTRRLRRVD